MNDNTGSFRFTYFTDIYDETCDFYKNKLDFSLEHSRDRNEDDKGALFKIGEGLVEILHLPNKLENKNPGLDYRIPQGIWMGIQVWHINELFEKNKEMEVPFKQEIVDQSWGHRSFSVLEPNGLLLLFYEELF
jgi:hypothetical protein